jgi:hypothetical protein
MGVSLSYWATSRVPDAVASAIKADAERVNATRDWWCEPLLFFDWPETGSNLAGDTKPSFGSVYGRPGNYVDVDDDDNQFMAGRDFQFIIDQLCKWSREYSVSWRLNFAGGDLGVIENGQPDPSAFYAGLYDGAPPDSVPSGSPSESVALIVAEMFASKHRPATAEAAERLAEEISRKYASRKPPKKPSPP